MDRPGLTALGATLVGLLGTLAYHWSMLSSGLDTFAGDRGDARLMLYLCEHWYHSMLGQAQLLSPGEFYPVPHLLAHSDALLGLAVPYCLLRFVGVEMFAAMQLTMLAMTLVTYGLAYFLLHRVLRLGGVSSALGAAFIAFNSPRFLQSGHFQMQATPFLIVMQIGVASLRPGLGRGTAFGFMVLIGAALDGELLTSFYLGWFAILWGGLALLVALVLAPGQLRRDLVQYRGTWLGAGLATAVGMIPLFVLYLPVLHHNGDFGLSPEAIPHGWSLVNLGDGRNYAWGWLLGRVGSYPRPEWWWESMQGIGLIPTVAWLSLTVLAFRKVLPTPVRVAILATSLGFALDVSLLGHSAWNLVYAYVPGAGAIRAMGRFMVVLTLPIGVVLAWALDTALARLSGRRRLLLLAVAVLGLLEQFGAAYSGCFSVSRERAYLEALARRVPPESTALYAGASVSDPHTAWERSLDAMMVSVMRGVPTLNGYTGVYPRGWELRDPSSTGYLARVQAWINRYQIKEPVYALELIPPVEAYDPAVFVPQHYRDFLGREPSADELRAELNGLGPGDMVPFSMRFFHRPEFYERGGLVCRLYLVGLGCLPDYAEFRSGMKNPQEGDFRLVYATLDARQFVARLVENAGCRPAAIDAQIALLQSGRISRAQFLEWMAEQPEVVRNLYDRTTAALAYFGYLQRAPDPVGYQAFLRNLQEGRLAAEIRAFLESAEYSGRIGAKPKSLVPASDLVISNSQLLLQELKQLREENRDLRARLERQASPSPP